MSYLREKYYQKDISTCLTWIVKYNFTSALVWGGDLLMFLFTKSLFIRYK